MHQGLDHRSKMEEVMPKTPVGEAQMRDNSEEDELNPEVDARSRRCTKNSPSVLSCIDKRTQESCDRASKARESSQRAR